MNKRKNQLEAQQSIEKQISDHRLAIDTLLSGIRNDISMPLYNLIHIEGRLNEQTDDDTIHELCMIVQAAADEFSHLSYKDYYDEDLSSITERRNRLFSSVDEKIIEPLHEITRLARHTACTVTDEGIKKDAEMTEAYAEYLEYAIRDIYDVISISTGALKLNERRFHLSELISDVTFIALNIAEVKELAFECISDPDTPEFWVGDDIRIRQAVLDICNDSIRHTTEGLIRLYVSKNNDGGLTFVISDTGNGTDEADGDSNGISIAKSLGGNVRTEHVIRRGSEVIIDLPLNEGRQIADADGLLDTEEGLSFYDNDADEYRQVLLLFCDMAPSYRDSIINDTENTTDVIKSLYRAARSIGAESLSERLKAALSYGVTGDDFTEIFDETMYRVAGYAGRR